MLFFSFHRRTFYYLYYALFTCTSIKRLISNCLGFLYGFLSTRFLWTVLQNYNTTQMMLNNFLICNMYFGIWISFLFLSVSFDAVSLSLLYGKLLFLPTFSYSFVHFQFAMLSWSLLLGQTAKLFDLSCWKVLPYYIFISHQLSNRIFFTGREN